MLKISQKMRQTNSTFMMEGIAPTRAFTTVNVLSATELHAYKLLKWKTFF